MEKTTKQKLNRLFYVIAGFAFAAATAVFWMTLSFFSTHRQIPFLFQLLTIVLFAQSFSSIGLARHWFDHFFIRAGKIINILQWIAGFLAAASIFDLFMKFIHDRAQFFDASFAFVIDIILILLFVFWMAVSYYINKDVKERKVCEFC